MPPIALPLEWLVRGLVLLAAASAVAFTLRRHPASVRATVWTAAMAALIAMPLVGAVAPALRVPVATTTASAMAGRAANRPVVSQEMSRQAGSEDPAYMNPDAAPLDAGSLDAGSKDPAYMGITSIDWAGAALALWLVIATALLTRIVASHGALRRAIARSASHNADPAWRAIVSSTARKLGVARRVQIRMTSAVSVPAVAGFLRPVLLLPPDANHWPDDRRRAVALHELAHVARWDSLSQLVSQIACALYWCVPFVWLAARRAAVLRERASDDVVLRHGVRPSAYAANLLELVRDADAGVGQAVLAMTSRSRLRERVEAILDPIARRDRLSRRAGASVAVAATIAMTAIALVQPTTRQILLPTAAAAERSRPPGDRVAPAPAPAPAVVPRAGKDAQPPVDQAAPRLCSGDLNQSSTSIRGNDGRRTWTIRLSGPECTVDLRMEGRVQFADDFSDITSIDDGGVFRLDMTERGVARHLELRGRSGSVERTYRVDGRDRPYDAEARAWFAAFLVELDRRTAVGVDVRLPHLLRQGGVGAVLGETALMTSDHARTAYYTKLATARQLGPDEIAQVLRQAATSTRSDHYAAEVIRAVGSRGLEDAAVREATTQLIDGMESDHYRAESIRALMSAGQVTSRELDFLVRMVPRMTSDHYRTETLSHVLRQGRPDGAQLGRLAEAARSIENDHYAAEFIRALVAAGAIDASARQAFDAAMTTIDGDHYLVEVIRSLIRARPPAADDVASILRHTRTIQSAHYRREALSALLGQPSLNARQLLDIVADARQMRGDHYVSEVLRQALRHGAVNEDVRQAVLDAAAGLSQHYANEIRRAAGR
jgi:beta-lactamase regulating signal transducer with metallopeptidase domain